VVHVAIIAVINSRVKQKPQGFPGAFLRAESNKM
jgi:hypothetical protein